MKASEYIEAFKKLMEEHGDLEVHTTFIDGRRIAPKPKLANIKILKGRESRCEFFGEFDTLDRRGTRVYRI